LTSPFKEDLELVQANLKRVSAALPGDDLAELEAATAALSGALEALSRNLPASEDERQTIIQLQHQTGQLEKELAVRSLPAHDQTRRKKAKFGYH